MPSYPLADSRFVNVAAGKPARQSTLSPWSGEKGAGGVLVMDDTCDFGFHTAEEDSPWWQVDLQSAYPIEAIVLYNRRNLCTERARTVSVAISEDGEAWTTVHSGLAYFGHGADRPPLSLPLASQVRARFVRLQLHEHTAFHLWHVAVLVELATVRAIELRQTLGLSYPVRDLDANGKGNAGYDVIAARPQDISGPLIGLDVNDNGAFGNSVVQYATAVEMAQALGLSYVRAATGKLIQMAGPVTAGKVTILPGGTSLPEGGCFLRGNFFFRNHLNNALRSSTPESYHDLIRHHISRLYGKIDLTRLPKHPKTELAIHIRSGDIFRTWIHADYVQPPLAFYQLVVDRLLKAKQIKSVRLIFEDRGNPVVDALEARLKASGIPVTCQSGSVEDDITALIDARHMVYGIGTFGIGVVQFSGQIESVYYFSPDGGCPYSHLPNIRHVVHVTDQANGYIKVGTWANTPEQRQMMVDYPVENLAVVGEWTHPPYKSKFKA